MPTYLTLLRYTQQGVEKIKDSPTRLTLRAYTEEEYRKIWLMWR